MASTAVESNYYRFSEGGAESKLLDPDCLLLSNQAKLSIGQSLIAQQQTVGVQKLTQLEAKLDSLEINLAAMFGAPPG